MAEKTAKNFTGLLYFAISCTHSSTVSDSIYPIVTHADTQTRTHANTLTETWMQRQVQTTYSSTMSDSIHLIVTSLLNELIEISRQQVIKDETQLHADLTQLHTDRHISLNTITG